MAIMLTGAMRMVIINSTSLQMLIMQAIILLIMPLMVYQVM